MSYPIPDLDTLIERAALKFADRLGISLTTPRGNLAELGPAAGGLSREIHNYFRWTLLQRFIQTADLEFLIEWGEMLGTPRKSPSPAVGTIRITATVDQTLPTGARMTRPSDSGVYFTTGPGEIINGTGTAPIAAVEPGVNGAVKDGVEFTLTPGVLGVTKIEAAGDVGGGADEEDVESYRSRLLQRIQNPPMGGTDADWERWALEVPGVTRVWVVANYIDAYRVLVTIATDLDPNGPAPSDEKIREVQDYLKQFLPSGGEVLVQGPTLSTVNYTLSIDPTNPSLQQRVIVELEDLFTREAKLGTDWKLSRAYAAVGSIPQIEDVVITAPAGDVSIGSLELPVLGTVTFS